MASLCTILSISFTILLCFRASHTVLTLVTCFTEPENADCIRDGRKETCAYN